MALLVSCTHHPDINNTSTTGAENTSEATVEQSGIEDTNQKNDTALIKFSSQINEIKATQEDQSKQISKIAEDQESLKGSSNLYTTITFAIAVIALVIGIIALVILYKYNLRLKRLSKQIHDLQEDVMGLEQHNQRKEIPQSGISQKEWADLNLNSLKTRVSKLERDFKELSKGAPTPFKQGEREEHSKKTGYFKLPSQLSSDEVYFVNILENRSPDSRFRAEVIEESAKFWPIEEKAFINAIRSSDTIRLALELKGCASSLAKIMEVNEPGEAKFNGERWMITKKAVITLSK